MPELLNIALEVYAAKEKSTKVYPCHSNRASEIGHPCVRYLVYSRLDWDKKLLPSAESQFIFDGGNMIEELAKKELEMAGFDVVEKQRSYAWDKYNITGHIDFMCRDRNEFEFPVEVKGLQEHDFKKLGCIDDFIRSRKPWIRKYPAQLTLYLLMANKQYGCFYLKGKQSLKPKHIWMDLDYGYAETLVKKAELVNELVAKKEYPERIEYEEYTCGYCPFAHICLQDIVKKEVDFSDDIEFGEKIEHLLALRELTSEYADLLDEIKSTANGKDMQVVGKFNIKHLNGERVKYNVPKEIKEQYKEYTKSTIVKVDKI